MKKLLLLIVCLTFSFAYELEFNKSFSKEIANDEITSYITISSKKNTQNRAINGLSKYKKLMDKFNDIKKTNIRQNSYPEYRYEKFSNKRVFDGYKATLNYTISSKDAGEATKYLESLLDIKKDDEDIHINFSNLSYKVSKEKKQLIEDELRLEAITWANTYAKEISSRIVQACKVEKIVIGGNNFRPIHRAYATMSKSVAMESSVDVSIPTPSDTSISINSSFQFSCK